MDHLINQHFKEDRNMRIGLQVNRFDWPNGPSAIPDTLDRIAKTVDEGGFYSLWVMDHFLQLEPMLGPATDPMLEGYSTLSFLAARTERVRLGTMVTGIIYRHPGYLIKSVSNLDVLSGGRAYFGVGAAWYEREAEALGFPFPPVATRFEQLEETLRLAKQVWCGNFSPFLGEHFQLQEPIINPRPLADPHPPILIGGMGEKKTLRLVAEYGDACNLFFRAGSDVLKHKLEVLRGHCQELGRPFQEIELTTLGTVNLDQGEMSPSDVIEKCEQLAGLGFQHVIFNMPNVHRTSHLELLGREVIPEVREL
jgi:F420-dependent oxidoreductase-like protein